MRHFPENCPSSCNSGNKLGENSSLCIERINGITRIKPTLGAYLVWTNQGKTVKTPSKDQMTAQPQSPSKGQPGSNQIIRNGVRRRSFIKGLGLMGAALLPPSALLVNKANAHAG